MTSQWISVDAADGGRFDAYLSLPPSGKGPGLVLFEEIFGVNRHIRAVVDQYALNGFVVIAPDMFWRQEPRMELGYEGADRDKAVAAMKAADPAKLLQDIGSTIKALRGRPEVSGKIAALGFCMGGRLAYQAASTGEVDAAVCLYGGGIQGELDRVAKINIPMQFHYGEKDAGIPLDAVEKVKAAFAAKKQAEFFLYPDAGHGFNCWDRGSYHAKSAALSHGRALQFLAQNLL
ncbi:MAG: dienelactone hydrolase family protein [Pseudomonadota bacterium]